MLRCYAVAMTTPADRLLDLFGDEIVRRVVRCLLAEELTQKDLIARVDAAQSSVSKAVGLLRTAGVVEARGLRAAALIVRQPAETLAVLMAADRLAEALAVKDTAAQADRSREDRLLGIRPADESPASAPDAP